MPVWTPVMSSSWDSLKSVVMCGWVSAAPRPGGCGLRASVPSAIDPKALLLHAATEIPQTVGAQPGESLFDSGQANSLRVVPAPGAVDSGRGAV